MTDRIDRERAALGDAFETIEFALSSNRKFYGDDETRIHWVYLIRNRMKAILNGEMVGDGDLNDYVPPASASTQSGEGRG